MSSEKVDKSKYWLVLGYPESMIDDWEIVLRSNCSYPVEYVIHNKDYLKNGSPDKVHVHFIIAFPNPRPESSALKIVNSLSKSGCRASASRAFVVVDINAAHNYLRHDNDDCRKKNKFLYPKEALVQINNFDIGHYEQVSIDDEREIRKSLVSLVKEHQFITYLDLVDYVMFYFDDKYFDEVSKHTIFYKEIIKSVYFKVQNSDKSF